MDKNYERLMAIGRLGEELIYNPKEEYLELAVKVYPEFFHISDGKFYFNKKLWSEKIRTYK